MDFCRGKFENLRERESVRKREREREREMEDKYIELPLKGKRKLNQVGLLDCGTESRLVRA